MAGRRKRRAFIDRRADRARLIRRIVLIGCGLAGILLTAGVIVWYQILAYLQGEDFRLRLCRELQSATQAQSVRMRDNLRINGDIVSQSELQLTGIGNIRSIGAERIQAHIERRELLDRKLHIRKLSMEEGNIEFLSESRPAPRSGQSAAAGKPQPRTATAKHGTRKKEKREADSAAVSDESAFTPNSFRLDLAECRDTGIILNRNNQRFSLSGCNITARPANKGRSWNIELEDGRLHTPFDCVKDTNLKSATLFCQDASLDLTECRLMLTPGELRAKASFNRETEQWSGVLQLHKADIARILRGDWRKKLTGELFGSCVLRGEQDVLQSAEGSISLHNGVLEGLPFLSELSIDNTRPYRRIEWEKADCNIIYPYSAPERALHNAWLFDKINLQSRGNTLIIRGHVIIAEGGALSGQLTIGLPQHTVDRLPLPGNQFITALFNGQGDTGYAWVNINLSGTVDSPEEDLSVRLSTLISRSLPGAAPDFAGNMLQKLIEHTEKKKNTPTKGNAPESDGPVESIINGASEFLNRGLRTLF